MADHPSTWERTAADDILDYAMGLGLLATFGITAALLVSGFPVIPTILGMSIIGGLWVFTITPHLVAYWVGTSVDALLGIEREPEQPLHVTQNDVNPTSTDPADTQNEHRA